MSKSQQSESPTGIDLRARDLRWPIPGLFAEYGRGYGRWIAFALALSAVAPLASLVPTFVLQAAIDSVLLDAEPLSLPGVPDSWLPGGRLPQLYLLSAVIVASAGISALTDWASQWLWGRFAQAVQHDVRTDTYRQLQDLGMGFFENQQTGQLLSVLNNDVNQLDDFLSNFLGNVVQITVMMLGIATIMVALHWQLAIVALVVVPVLAGMSRYFIKRIQPKYETVRQRVGMLNARMENNLEGARVTKVYAAEPHEAERVESASRDLFDARWDAISTRVKLLPAMNFVNWLGFGVIVIVGGIWIVDGPPLFFTESLSVGVLVAFLVYNQQFTRPLLQVGSLVDQYYDARSSVVRIFALRDREPEIEDDDADPLGRVEGRVTFDDVTFTYPGEDEPALRNVSFEVEPGAFVGIVGPTGSGKTTLTKLLLRFYDPDEGSVRIDGRDLRTVNRRALRDELSAVAQEPYLFSGTVRENVAYGTRDASDEAVVRAARMANSHDFVTGLQDGYETRVGQRGARLSGGQRQRIAIARALLDDPRLLILDEATSHVDNETEALIQRALGEVVEDRTTFAIAHRLSTVRHADTIVVLDGGEVVERGTHAELLERDGLYADLWRIQVGEVADLPERFLEQHVRERPSEPPT